MQISHKHHFTNNIRSSKPVAPLDDVFVERLSAQLQQRAEFLPSKPNTETQHKKQWFLFGTLGVGALTVGLAALVFVPQYFIKTKQVAGYVQKGPFISGSTIIIQELDDKLQPNGKTYQVVTNSDFGDYTLSKKMSANYVEVIAQGYYYNEVTGALSAAPLTLRAVAQIAEHSNININVLTTLASPRIRYLVEQQQLSFVDAKQEAEREVLQLFQMQPSNIAAFETMNISQDSANNGVLLAASVILQGQQSVAELSELLAKLSLDIEIDGKIDNQNLLTLLQNNASHLNTYSIKNNLEKRYQALGVEGTIPVFTQYIKPLALDATPLAYRISLEKNTFLINHKSDATIQITINGEGFVANQEEVLLKNLFSATAVTFIDDKTLQATLPISSLSPGSYTVMVRNTVTGRIGVTDGEPIESEPTSHPQLRLILQGDPPNITSITPTVSYLTGGTIIIQGQHFAHGTFVWINDWEVPTEAVQVNNEQTIQVDLSSALIANNTNLPRKQNLTIKVQTPDFQKAEYSGFEIR
ncbi:MAG: IPT/TIG domain-containing protein [Patescibacteria group bacterium]|jgi:hypothetical protein